MKFLLQASLILLTLFFTAGEAEASQNPSTESDTEVTRLADSDAAVDEPQVTLYMTSWCGYCRKTERLLENLDVTYQAIDIEKVPGARAEKQRHQPRCGVPVTVIGDQSVCGFSEAKIRQLVAKLQSEAESSATSEVAER